MPRIIDPPTLPLLDDGARVGGWWHAADDGRLVCDLCPRECHLQPGDRGFCFVRENRDGQVVLSTYGRSTGFCIDPIEKKPLNHFYPGTSVLSFGTAGCNLGCKFCQNWDISKSREVTRLSERASPAAIAAAACQHHCQSVAFTYNDPVIWAEYAIDTARECHARDIRTVAVTAGYISEVARSSFFQAMDAANVDLKAFTEEFYYRTTSSHLQPVLDTIQWLASETDIWFELTNLVIPRANDSTDEIRRMCDWIVKTAGPCVPVHFTAFHPDFRMRDRPRTPVETLLQAHEIAREHGLQFVYVGNVHDEKHQSTWCPGCGQLLIERDWYELGRYKLDGNRCSNCGTQIAGRFAAQPGNWGARRQPVQISDFEPPARPPSPTVPPPDRPESNTTRDSSPPSTQIGNTGHPVPLSTTQQQQIHMAACELIAERAGMSTDQDPRSRLRANCDQTVMGAFVTAKKDGQLRGCCGRLGSEMSIAEAVTEAALRTAASDPRFPPIGAEELDQLTVDVTLLHDFRPITASGRERINQIEIGRDGLRIRRGEQAGLLLPVVAIEHKMDVQQFLEAVCRKAGLPRDAWLDPQTRIEAFQGQPFGGPFPNLSGPRQPIRPPAVAGRFYPDDAGELQLLIERLFAGLESARPQRRPAVMLPHAGLIYSGRVAAETLSEVEVPERVIVLGPKHTPYGLNWTVAPHGSWSLPGQNVAADPQLAGLLAERIDDLQLDPVAHQYEHAIEVELPLLAHQNPAVQVTGIAIGRASLDSCLRCGRQLANVLRELDSDWLLVISSDMNHFADDTTTRRLDHLALEAMKSGDPQQLFETVAQHDISMCGVLPAVIVLQALRSLGWGERIEQRAYATSGDVSGDRSRVVGYAGMLCN